MVTVINLFTYSQPDKHPKLDINATLNKAFKGDMQQMENIVRRLVRSDKHLIITFTGSQKSGLQYKLECDDTKTVCRVQKALEDLERQQDIDFFN